LELILPLSQLLVTAIGNSLCNEYFDRKKDATKA